MAKEKNPKAVAVGGRIASLRTKIPGLSQDKLAAKIGVTGNAITQYECGNNLPSLAHMELIASELHTTVGWLLTGDEPDEVARAQTQTELAILRALREVPANLQEVALATVRALSRR